MRLIDADILIEKIGIGKDCNECQHSERKLYCNWKPDVVDICEAICTAPTIEPELIRCKDCKYYSHPWHCEAWNNSPGFPAVSDEMFCSMAERRTDE